MLKLLRDREIAVEGIFDPETVPLMTAAFDDAWQLIQDSAVTFESDAQAEEARLTLAKYIIEAVKQGERNQLRLRDDALAHYAMSIMKPDED